MIHDGGSRRLYRFLHHRPRQETAEKVQSADPAKVQTGPAIRNDENTMAMHQQLLKGEPQLQQLYFLLSQGIIKLDDTQRGDK